MSQFKTVKAAVEHDLTKRLEQGQDLKAISKNSIDSYTYEFRKGYAHLLPYSYSDATVNRAVERFVKAKYITVQV